MKASFLSGSLQAPGKHSYFRIKMVAISLVLAACIFMLFQVDLSGIDKYGYYPEDWISYTKTRFVRSVSIGFYNIYLGTTEGILRYDMEFDEWLDPITEGDGLPDQNIQRIAASPDDTHIWVTTPSGIYEYITTFEEWSAADEFPYEYYNNDVSRIGDFQRYNPPFGYHIFPPNIIRDSEFREYPIMAAVESKWGDIWLGTWGLGMGKIARYGADLNFFRFGLYTSDCRAMYQKGERFYFGGRNEYGAENALTIWDRKNNTWKYLEARYNDRFISDQVNDILGVGDNIYLATDFGLVKMGTEGNDFRSYTAPGYLNTDIVLSLAYNKGQLYLGTDQGMYTLNIKSDSIRYMGGDLIGDAAIYDILYYKDDLWIGSEYGAVRYDLKTQRFYRYSSVGGALLGLMMDVEKDNEDGLWFAGEDAIVWMSDRFDEKERFYVDVDLGGFIPNRILVSERYLWVGTGYGLYRYDRLKHYWKHFLQDQGLIDDNIYDLILDNDYLWIATARGVTRYYWNNPMRGEDF